MVQVLIGDPEPLLYGDEQLYRDGEHVGESATARTATRSAARSASR